MKTTFQPAKETPSSRPTISKMPLDPESAIRNWMVRMENFRTNAELLVREGRKYAVLSVARNMLIYFKNELKLWRDGKSTAEIMSSNIQYAQEAMFVLIKYG
ncbi:hypothetical protein KJ780_05210, partial [Candidatus Micrarchaeota archaeon]|nr:hypothetical protein [Candidatus Micrarchaeota archaeon]